MRLSSIVDRESEREDRDGGRRTYRKAEQSGRGRGCAEARSEALRQATKRDKTYVYVYVRSARACQDLVRESRDCVFLSTI